MPGPLQRLLTRAAVPKAGLGNLIVQPSGGGGAGPRAASQNVTWNSPGQPQTLDQDSRAFGEESYLNQVYVMRCVQTIAQTIAGLDWRAGMDPTNPSVHDPAAPLVQLLGPGTPQAPGGPNPETAARALWAWTIAQYIVYGCFGWECQLLKKQIIGLWPLVMGNFAAIPSQGGNRWFDAYQITTPQTGDIRLTRDQVIYAWRPSLIDWRIPETVLSAAKLPIYIAKGMDRYMTNLLKNDMVASTLVVTPPFDEPSGRRAWQEQFLTSFTGVDNRGKTIFAEAEYDEDDTSGKPLVQVEKIAQTALDAQLLEISKEAKIDITIALGVPVSLIGNASERIYANADSEYRNFWVLTVMNLIQELQDHINLRLAPRIGDEVGWFDLSRVSALQPPSIFAPPMIGDVINMGVATAAQVANVLQIPAATSTDDSDTDTVELGEESTSTGAGNGANRSWRGTRVNKHQLIDARIRYETRALNSYNWDQKFRASDWLVQEHIDVRTVIDVTSKDVVPSSPAIRARNAEAIEILERVGAVKSRAELSRIEQRKAHTAELVQRTVRTASDIRALAVADRTTDTVHKELSQHYPQGTLDWVHAADWTGPKEVPLDEIDFGRRPGGRDPKKVEGIAKALVSDPNGAAGAPVILVKTPGEDQLQVADGYHRLLAHKRLGHTSVPAFIGEVDSDDGPWSKEMHDQKLNREAQALLVRGRINRPQKCKYCAEPATKAHLWAEGAAYVPTCDVHVSKAHQSIGGPQEVDDVRPIPQERSYVTHAMALGAARTSPGADWHNSDGLSPFGTKEQFIHHMIDVHGVTNVQRSMSREELDQWHASDHSKHGECGAHEPKNRAVDPDHDGDDDSTPGIMPYAGTDIDQWLADNVEGLMALAEEEEELANA